MEEKSLRGGKRIGAGRKPVDNPKKQFAFYFKRSDIWKFGSEEKMKFQISNFVDKYGGDERSSIPEITPTTPLFVEERKIAIKRTPQLWVEIKRDIDDADDYKKWLADLENDPYLTVKEKQSIKAS